MDSFDIGASCSRVIALHFESVSVSFHPLVVLFRRVEVGVFQGGPLTSLVCHGRKSQPAARKHHNIHATYQGNRSMDSFKIRVSCSSVIMLYFKSVSVSFHPLIVLIGRVEVEVFQDRLLTLLVCHGCKSQQATREYHNFHATYQGNRRMDSFKIGASCSSVIALYFKSVSMSFYLLVVCIQLTLMAGFGSLLIISRTIEPVVLKPGYLNSCSMPN
jgi:hypothetical protein